MLPNTDLNIWNILKKKTLTNEDIAWIKNFLESKTNIDAKNNDDWTLLHVAALKGHFEVVQLLIENGVNLHAKNDNGWDSLYIAASNGHLEVVQLLIEKGLDLEAKNILEELIKCEKRKLLASVEKPRLVNYLARYTELVDISFLLQLKRENTLNQQSEKEKPKQTFSMND
jgi:ankyrin repeat protein